MLPTKIVVIGAGSASFGLNTLAALMGSQRLRGSHIVLVDRNAETLQLVGRLAERLNREWDAQMRLSLHTHHAEALENAEFVVQSIEVPPREKLWQSDYEIPLKHGVRQPYAENGGPGGFAHALRNIGPVMEIAHAMEQACPNAWLINYTNPMARICDAVARYSRIKVVGLCHQIYEGYAMAGYVLGRELGFDVPTGVKTNFTGTGAIPPLHQVGEQAVQRLAIQAAGLNHFTWMLAVHDQHTGEDLYPRFAKCWANFDPDFEPLTRKVYQAFGVFPIPGDEHLCEYLPWCSDPVTKPWEKFELSLYNWEKRAQFRQDGYADIRRMGDGQMSVEPLRSANSEGALEIIENIAGAGMHVHLAVNLPNRGYIANLPEGAMVEVPGIVSGAGIQGVAVGVLPEPIAELCRREITATQLCVDAAVHGDRQAALQCLLLSPTIIDLDVAQQVLDDYLTTYREHLPQFWR